MSDADGKLNGPDLTKGVPVSAIADGAMLLGHADGEPALLARRGEEVFAIGAICTHYGAPLEQGLLVRDTVRCQWHHACFDLHTGEALRAPALNPVSCWRVEQQDGIVYVREKRTPAKTPPPSAPDVPGSVVIVGGGGAGNAAAEMLRREGYAGRLTMLSADQSIPCDRPNLSKGFLAGSTSEESNPLRSADFYRKHAIDLKLGTRVATIDTASRHVQLADGSRHRYDALLLATGAEPVQSQRAYMNSRVDGRRGSPTTGDALGPGAPSSGAGSDAAPAKPLFDPRWLSWIFAPKTTASSLLALLVAFTLRSSSSHNRRAGLCSQRVSTVSSGRWLGAAGALLLVSLFSQERVLFLGTLAAWIGLCTFASKYARNFAAYGFVLSGYTVAIVGIPGALDPGNAFFIAVARVTEISLGIMATARPGGIGRLHSLLARTVSTCRQPRGNGRSSSPSGFVSDIQASQSCGRSTTTCRL
jgi:nitrite reductase/ring-hydroxylating ferredoxin subunit